MIPFISMVKPSSATNSDDTTYHTVFIDTDLDTHLAMIVSSTDTVSDLKQKIMLQHPQCFPQIGDIQILALKVKRRGRYYHLSDSMLVKSAFHGINKTWFISVAASSVNKHDNNQHFLNPDCNNMVVCYGISCNGSVHGVNLLHDGCPRKLSSVIDKQHLEIPVAARLILDVAGNGEDARKDLEIRVEQMGDKHGIAKSVDINNGSDSHTLEKVDQCDNENEIQKTPIGGSKTSSRTGIEDVPGSLLPEGALETGHHAKKKPKGKSKSKHPIYDLALKEDISLSESGKNESQPETVVPQSFLEITVGTRNKNSIEEPSMVSYSDANRGMDSIMQGTTVLSEETRMLGRHDGSINDKSRRNCNDVQCFQLVEDASQSKPAAKKKRKNEEGKKGEDLLKDDQTLISDSNKKMLENPTVSQQFLLDKMKNINAPLDGSSTDTPEVVHLQSVDPTNEKRKKKSSNTRNQEIAAPSSGTNVGEENRGDLKDLCEEFKAEFFSGQHIHSPLISEHGGVSLTEKDGNPLQEANTRLSSQEFDGSNRAAGSVKDRNIETVGPSKSSKKRKKTKKAKEALSGTPSTSVTEQVKGSDIGTSPTEPHKAADGDHSDDNINKQESDISLKDRKEVPIAPHKADNGDHFGANVNTQEINIHPEDRKEVSGMDTISTSFLATDKEIDNVIQNVVESVQQIRKGQVDSQLMDVTSRKKTRKKRSSYKKKSAESEKVNENVGDKPAPADNIGEVAGVMKQAKLANADSTIQLHGSNLEGEKEITFENDPHSPQSSQVKPHRMERNREGSCVKAVVNGNPSDSGHTKGNTDAKEVSRESNGIDFNDYFLPSQNSHKNVDSAEVLVDKATETRRVDGKMKVKEDKRKHDAHSHGPSPELHSSQRLNENHAVGVNTQGDNSSTGELLSSVSNMKSENVVLQPNEEPLNASRSVAKVLLSSTSDKFDSVPEEARIPNAAKPSVTSAHAKSKRATPNSSLENSKNRVFLNTRVNGLRSRENHNHMDGKRTSRINTGEVVNNSQHKKSLIGASGSIFNDDSYDSSMNESDNSDASTRTPSDNSLSSDYSDGESNTDFNSSQNGFHSWKRKEGGGKAFTKQFSSGMTLDTILRSSSRYKKAKLTASQSQAEDTESQPVDFVPDSQANP